MAKTIKVNVTLSLTIDPEAWNLAYGCGETAALIREDVRSYFLNIAQQCAASEEDAIVEAKIR